MRAGQEALGWHGAVMSREFPDWINPWKAAEGKRIFSGSIPFARLSRLRSLLASEAGEARFTAAFSLDRDQRAMVDIEVTAELPLICQASLEEYLEPVSRKSRLAVVETELDQEMLPPGYEATCAVEGRLTFEDLVEDELLLALPQVPRKPGLKDVSFSSGTPAEDSAGEEETYRPFAGLADLMRGGRTNREN